MKKTIKIIDLLNKIANGEEVPKKIRIDHWSYKFEWVEHLDNYYDINADIDLMSVLSMSKEELNYGVEIISDEEEVEDKEYEDIEEFKEYKLINTKDILELEMLINKINADYNYKINALIRNQKKIIEKLNKNNNIQ